MSQSVQKQPCPYCAKEISHRHLREHIDRYHPDTIALALRRTNIHDNKEQTESPSESAVRESSR